MKRFNSVDETFWWEVAEACPYATFFHSPLWHRLACATYSDVQDTSVGAVLDDGTKVVLPLLERRQAKGMMRSVVSTFAGCYGGLIADGPVTNEAAQTIYGSTSLIGVGSFRINGNPLHTNIHSPPIARMTIKDDHTYIVDLKNGLDNIRSNFAKGHKSSINKSIRMGVKVRPANTLSDYVSYYGAYEDSVRRWGETSRGKYPWRLFENGYNLSTRFPDHIKLWVAEVKNTIIAGAWIFYWNRHVVYWHGAVYAEYLDHRPNNLLHAEIIQSALEFGYDYYDFNPSGGHEGVDQFKQRFGSERHLLKRWRYEGRPLRMLKRFRRAFGGG